ncbi:MAG: hypothetical protein EA382_10805 [Spirochaetaceae bacterium]|nr:MAG: hypothetical protein EA382_10805 [Spirochaetaceae bacterium]
MRLIRVVVLGVLTLVIAASVLIGQAAFRLERTLLRHDYVQAQIGEWFAPLEDPAHHQEFVNAMIAQISQALRWAIPVRLQPTVYEAARRSFTHHWLVAFARRAHTAAYRVTRGDRTPIRLTVSLSQFYADVASGARSALPDQQATAVAADLQRAPQSIDLFAELGDQARAEVEVWLRRLPLIGTLLQYALPGVLIALTLIYRRPGSAMVASGAGIAIGGVMMLGFIGSYRFVVAAAVARVVRAAVPGRPGWVEPPVTDTVAEAVASGAGFAWLLVATGAVLALLGVLVIANWSDSFGDTRRAAEP